MASDTSGQEGLLCVHVPGGAQVPACPTPPPLPLPDALYAGILRHALWPIINVCTGRTIHRKMRFLERSQWWSREQLEQLQIRKLRRLVQHVYERVPFYRREFRQRGLHPQDFLSPAALRALPVVTKEMLKAAPEDFLADDCSFRQLVHGRTSGSTGQPTRFFRTREQDSWHWAFKFRMWGMAGYRLGWPYVNLYNQARCGYEKRVHDFLFRNHDVYIFSHPNQEALLARTLECLARPNIYFLAGCTTPLRLLADYRAALPSPSPLHLRAVLSTGNLLTPADRKAIETSLGAPLWDHYGLGGEGAHVGAECEYKRGYHLNVENLIVEPADPTAAEQGCATDIYLTELDNFGWPLIRYATGDAALFSSRHCPCGRGLPLLERVEGRTNAIVELPNGVRLTAHYFAIIGRSDCIARYQVEQRALDRLAIRVVWRDNRPSGTEKARIAAHLQEIANHTLTIEFEDLTDLPVHRSGKHRYVIPLAEYEAPRRGVAEAASGQRP